MGTWLIWLTETVSRTQRVRDDGKCICTPIIVTAASGEGRAAVILEVSVDQHAVYDDRKCIGTVLHPVNHNK